MRKRRTKRNRKPNIGKPPSEFMKGYVEACMRLSFEVRLADEKTST